MPKFHFEIADGFILEDPAGMELADEQDAKRLADEMAKRIALDVDDQALKHIVVKTDDGDVVHTTPINRTERNDRPDS